MFHLFFRNAATVVADADSYVVVVAIRDYLKGDLAVLLRVFGCIRQQVEDNFVQFIGIYPAHHTLRLAADGELQAFPLH